MCAPASMSGLLLFVFEHDHNFHQLIGKLARQQSLKGICYFAVYHSVSSLGRFPNRRHMAEAISGLRRSRRIERAL